MPSFVKPLRLLPVMSLLLLPGLALAGRGAPVVDPATIEVQQRLDRIERLLETQALLDMHDQLQLLQREISQLRGELESQERVARELSKRMEALETRPAPAEDAVLPPLADLEDLDEELRAGEEDFDPALDEDGFATLPPADTELPDDAGLVEAAADFDPEEARAAYNHAFDLLKEAQYEAAINALENYLRDYPGGQDSANARYWLGEAYYVTRNYEHAITAYEQLIENHPDSTQISQAMLKIGYSQHELGDADAARETLQNVRRDYPGSTAARLAEDRLQRLTDS